MMQLGSQLAIGNGITTAPTPKHLHKSLILKVASYMYLMTVLLYGPTSSKMAFIRAQISRYPPPSAVPTCRWLPKTFDIANHLCLPAQPGDVKSFCPGSSWWWLGELCFLENTVCLARKSIPLGNAAWCMNAIVWHRQSLPACRDFKAPQAVPCIKE